MSLSLSLNSDKNLCCNMYLNRLRSFSYAALLCPGLRRLHFNFHPISMSTYVCLVRFYSTENK